jgi:hypothetical protein
MMIYECIVDPHYSVAIEQEHIPGAGLVYGVDEQLVDAAR